MGGMRRATVGHERHMNGNAGLCKECHRAPTSKGFVIGMRGEDENGGEC